MDKFSRFARIAETEFQDIVISSHDLGAKLRIYLTDKSFIDFFISSQSMLKRFSIHWERTHIDNTIYRLDNTPDKNWENVKSYPLHFHFKNYENVKVPVFDINNKPLTDIYRAFLKFVRSALSKKT